MSINRRIDAIRMIEYFTSQLHYYKNEPLTKDEVEGIANIRKELNKLAGPDNMVVDRLINSERCNDTDMLKYLKDLDSSEDGVVTLPAAFDVDDLNYLRVYGMRMKEIYECYKVPSVLFNTDTNRIEGVRVGIKNDSNVPKP